jgi:hypothetical protein
MMLSEQRELLRESASSKKKLRTAKPLATADPGGAWHGMSGYENGWNRNTSSHPFALNRPLVNLNCAAIPCAGPDASVFRAD